MDKRHRKLIASSQGRRLLWERKFLPTSAILLIVPDALFEHWYEQIQNHLLLSVFSDQTENGNVSNTIDWNVVYLDGLGDLADVMVGGRK
jgi:hypothetical protein